MNRARDALSAVEADISMLDIEAIVNAANEPLIMGGGVDGAIRRKAGPGMEIELRSIGHCATGKAIMTGGYRLPARHVIHTVAPIFSDGGSIQTSLLADCYRNALALARANSVSEIAFPCLGTGVYGWPPDRASRIAFDTVTALLGEDEYFLRVVFCCFSRADKDRYAALIASS